VIGINAAMAKLSDSDETAGRPASFAGPRILHG